MGKVTLTRDGGRYTLSDPIQIAAFKNSGWTEVKTVEKKETPKPEAEHEAEKKGK